MLAMKKIAIAALIALGFCVVGGTANICLAQKNPETRFGWKLGAQAYTFNRFNFFEAIDKIKLCGLQYVEAYPGQEIGGGLEGKMDYKMPAEKGIK